MLLLRYQCFVDHYKELAINIFMCTMQVPYYNFLARGMLSLDHFQQQIFIGMKRTDSDPIRNNDVRMIFKQNYFLIVLKHFLA